MTTRTFSEHTDNVTCLCATQKYLISGCEDKTVKVFKRVTGRERERGREGERERGREGERE